MAGEYYIMRRNKGDVPDKRVEKYETSLQAQRALSAMGYTGPVQYFIQYSKDAIKLYEKQQEALND